MRLYLSLDNMGVLIDVHDVSQLERLNLRADASSLHVKCVFWPFAVTEWETPPAVAETPEIKLFGKWSTDDVQINDISLQVTVNREGKKNEPELSVLCKARLESHLDIDQLAMCARAFVEKYVSVYSLAVVCCDPVNHRLRHTLSYVKYLNVFRSLQAATLTMACFPTGLHCREREVRQVPATLWRTLCRQAFPQGPVPHCGASDQLHDDARPQQRQKADDCPHCQARFWDHPPADGRGTELGSMHPVSPLTPGVTYRVSKRLNRTTRLWVLSDVG